MPLADVVRISHAHSVETWVLSRMRARRAAKGAPHALVVSDPKPVPGLALRPLPNAEKEARFVAELVNGLEGGQSMTLRDEAATCSNVVRVVNQSVPPVTHIHFACHAFADLRQPKQSGLILSDGKVLTVFDLADPARSPVATLRLAVLAACQTAVVGTDLVDEAIGLSAAWVQMGAATVVASLWPISDEATLAIMKKFYQLHLIDGLPPSDALWLAQRWLRGVPGWREDFEKAGAAYSSGQPDAEQERVRSKSPFALSWDHPVYWAAFVVYGD
jgi:CHAT domain-containing protein